MSRELHKGLGSGKAVGRSGIGNPGSLEALADRIDIADLHEEADGFIRANDLIETVMDNSGGCNTDDVLQAVEDAVELGARLARQADGDPIQMVTANDDHGVCRFYFIGPVSEVKARLKRLVA